jgi:hypothetical protein
MKHASCPGQPRPRPFPISWIWPLIDVPHQDVCAGLTDNRLTASIAPHGRLGSLLALGARYATKDSLTWAIDPALLDSVHAMKQRHRVGTALRCQNRRWQPASPYAAGWLGELRRATAGHPVFVTPYADVNVAALVRLGNAAQTADLRRSLAAGDEVAHRILGRAVIPAAVPAGRRRLSGVLWPPGGTASGALLTTLSAVPNRHINTVILTAPVPPVNHTPSAVTSTLTGTGRRLHVLLADRQVTALLGSRLASSNAPGAGTHLSQLFLAETAMIAAEAPGKPRPIVVAPPRRWAPTRALAGALLGETAHAPWLKPSTAGQLVAMKSAHTYKAGTQFGSVSEKTKRLLDSVSRLDHKIALLESIRVKANADLYHAVANIESSAWRGKAVKQATAMLERTWHYVDGQLHGVTIRGGGARGTYHVTFGGKTSSLNVNIHNGLNYPVSVGLHVWSSRATVTGVPASIPVGPRSFSTPIKLTVHVTANHGKIRLSLTGPKHTRGGRPQALPAAPLVILVHPTDFGTVALVICAVALAVFVIASAYRAIRAGRPEPTDDQALPGAGAAMAYPGDAATAARAGQQADVAQPAGTTHPPNHWGQGPERAEPAVSSPVEETIPDWSKAMIQASGLTDLGNRPERTDSVGADQSGRRPAGPPVTEEEPAAPSRRANQERR